MKPLRPYTFFSKQLLLLAALLVACSQDALTDSHKSDPVEAQTIVYRETFSSLGNPTQYLRIARAAEDWEIIEANGERWLRVYFEPSPNERSGLVVWDLVQMQFVDLSIEVRPQSANVGRVFLHATLFDREGTTYQFKPFGTADSQRATLTPGKWNPYSHSIPDGLARIFVRGAEVAPFLHGRGEQVQAWDSIDFSNRGYRTLHFNVDFASDSPAIGNRVYVDFKALTLKNETRGNR